jgi:hypothetical protein
MNWSYIFLAIFIYFIIIGCLCSSIRVVPYNMAPVYTNVSETFEEMEAKPNFANSLGSPPQEVLCKKVHGFKDLQCCPNSGFKTVDKFAFTKSTKGCPGIGLFNSKGNLCLDDNQIKLLKTRGGNMCKEGESGCKESQIGPN